MRSPFTNPQPSGRRHLNNKKGQMAILLALTIVALSAITGYAIDTANISLRQERLRRALDAGAIAGMNFNVAHMRDAGAQQNAIDAAVAVATFNLTQMGFTVNPGDVTANWVIDDAHHTATLNVNSHIAARTFFMGLVGITQVPISSVASVQRDPAYISMVLDTSGSMGGTPISSLRTAAQNFLDMFQEGVDHIALISFSTDVHVNSPITDDLNIQNLKNIISGFQAGGNTDLPEAIATARTQIENSGAPANAVKAIVLFTDGAPNVMRARLDPGEVRAVSNPSSLPGWQPLPPNPPSTSVYDYKVYVSVWHDYSQSPIGSYCHNRLFKEGENEYYNQDPPAVMEPCVDQNNRDTHEVSDCQTWFDFMDSKGNWWPSFQFYNSWNNAVGPNRPWGVDWGILYSMYDLSILESDYAKAENITVYVIGLGNPAPLPRCSDGSIWLGNGANCPDRCPDGSVKDPPDGSACPLLCPDNYHWYSPTGSVADCPQTYCTYDGYVANTAVCPNHTCADRNSYAYWQHCPETCPDGVHPYDGNDANCPKCPDGVTDISLVQACPTEQQGH